MPTPPEAGARYGAVRTPPALRFSEQSLRLFRRDVLVYSAQIVTEALIARALGPTAMGVWIVLRMLPAYAEVFGRSQVDTAAVYVLATGKYRMGAVAFAVEVISLLSAGLVIGVFLLLQGWLYSTFLRQAAGERIAVMIVLAYMPFRFLAICYNKLLLSNEDVSGYNAANVLVSLVPSVLGAAAVVVLHAGITGLAAALLVGGFAAVAYSSARIHARDPIAPHRDLRLMGRLLAFGSKLYLIMIVQYLHTYLSSLLVVLYMPAAQVAFFRMAQDRALPLARVPAAVSNLLYPRVARLGGDVEEARGLTIVSFRLALLILLAFGAVAAILVKPAVFILYGPAFGGVVLPLLLFIPGIIADASSSLLVVYYTGRGRLWILVGMTAVAVLAQLALLAFAITRWGIVGAAAASAAAYLLVMVMRVAVFCRLEGTPPADLLLIRRTDVAFVWNFFQRRLRLRALVPGTAPEP